MSVIEEWIEKLKKTENLYFYGAGTVSKRLLRFCHDNNITVNGVIVTDAAENPDLLEGLNVFGYEDMEEGQRRKANVYVAMAGKTKKWIDFFVDLEFGSVHFFSQAFLNEVYKEEEMEKLVDEFNSFFSENNRDYKLELSYPYCEKSQYTVIDRKSKMPILRLNKGNDCDDLGFLCNELENGAPFNLFKKMEHVSCSWNDYVYGCGIDIEGVKIFIVTSVFDKMDVQAESKGIYCPIQAGAQKAPFRKNCIGDDEGENISDRNCNYSECSALYWIWKHDNDHKYVGLEHYRRRLGLNKESIQKILNDDLDMCIVTPQYTALTIRDFFLKYISEGDWRLFKETYCHYKPDKKELFEKYEQGHYYLPCNVGMWKKTWLDKYCKWSFQIAEDINRFFEDRHIIREDRYMGYFFENMYTLAILEDMDNLKLTYTDIMQVY